MATPAQLRRHPWLYHMTPVDNLASIATMGLQPRLCQSRFGPMSLEAQTPEPKIFFLPILGGCAMRGFLDEWWHGAVGDIALLRIPFAQVTAWQSADPYNARHEVWSYQSVPAQTIQTRLLHEFKGRWRPLLPS